MKEPFTEEQLIQLINISNEKKQEVEGKLGGFPEKEEVQRIARKYNLNAEHFYFVDKTRPCYCYYDFPAYVTIDVFNDQFFDFAMGIQRIISIREAAMKAWEEKDYCRIFVFTEDQAKVLLLNKMYWLIEDDQKYDLYKEVYTLLDYGHTLIDKDIKHDVWKHQSVDRRIEIRDLLDDDYQGDVLTVYRGEGSESTPYDQSMSWTTSLSVACFFATRIRSDLHAKVYQARVRKEHVLDYDNHRNEKEIIVFPEQLEDVEIVPMTQLVDEWSRLEEEGHLDEYVLYKNTFIKESHYKHPQGIHGIHHVKRVLFHAITLSRLLRLSDSDRAILANASIYHDIGRKHDYHCKMHGEWSWKQYVRNLSGFNPLIEVNCVAKRANGEKEGYDIRNLTIDEVGIVRFLIEYHCRDDEEGQKALQKMHLHKKAKDRYWRLYQIFKDCDGLDRVRLPINELDVKYFRTNEAKNRLVYAFQVQNHTDKL
ncbi:HD domain-containing protein [Brevibacillus sp. NPDC058079]|uniref:HD domain-containing protein n=1 Tax=Brevibacillus sp. NPDC058079 TaxID=3346330 RepID=UPI0036E06430